MALKRFNTFAVLSSLYLSQGLPYGFFTQAVPTVLRQQGVSLVWVGASSALALPWMLKALWAPLVDRVGSERFGHRKSWIVPLQVAAVALSLVLAGIDPIWGATALAAGMFTASLLSATQDIATDGLAVAVLAERDRGIGNGIQVAAYRLGMILGGGALLVVYERAGWSAAFVSMAALLALGTLPILGFREPAHQTPAPSTGSSWWRPGLGSWAVLLISYKLGPALAGAMLRPMLVDLKWSLEAIGIALGTVASVAGLLGALVGGVLASRFPAPGLLRGLAVLQALTLASLAVVPEAGLLPAIAAETFASGMATAALFTAMMACCREGHEATDYTVQACIVVTASGLAATGSGILATAIGYSGHFALAAIIAAVAATLTTLRPPEATP